MSGGWHHTRGEITITGQALAMFADNAALTAAVQGETLTRKGKLARINGKFGVTTLHKMHPAVTHGAYDPFPKLREVIREPFEREILG